MKLCLRWAVQRFAATVAASVIVLVMFYCNAWRDRSAEAEGNKKIITIDNQADGGRSPSHVDISVALRSAGRGTTIQLQEGKYVVDNPVILESEGVTIAGRGREKTIIRPKNAGKAVFEFAADHLRLENIAINTETVDGSGRGTFGVHIRKGRSYSAVLNSKVLNSGASAIIGHSIRNCRLEGNIIVNAGDDGIQLRGDLLTVANNIIARYFDEAIDLASGDDIAVVNNHTRAGRIGITVTGDKNIVVNGNVVEDHVFGGFNIVAQQSAVVTHNIVRDSVGAAYQLKSPGTVTENLVEGDNDVGFMISDMHNGIIRNNVVRNARVGIRLSKSTGNRIYGNEYFGATAQPFNFDDVERGANQLGNNKTTLVRGRAVASKQPGDRGSVHVSEPTEVKVESAKLVSRLLRESATDKGNTLIKVEGESQRDRRAAEALAQFLARQNPGFISIEVRDNVIKSQITEDLYLTLRGSGNLGLGIVRAPIGILRRVSGTIFPVWHLIHPTEEVAIVTARLTERGANILFTRGEQTLKRLFIMSIARVAHLLTVSVRMFGYEVEDIYYGLGRKFWTFAILPIGFALGVGVLWGMKRAQHAPSK